MHPDASSTQVQLTSTICTAFAIGMTLLRLYIRRRSAWVDDCFAISSMCFLATQMGVILTSRDAGNIDGLHRAYLVMTMFYATVWSARMSILFTIMRIGRGRSHYGLLSAIAALFTFFWALLTGQLFWTCEMERRASPAPLSTCTPTKQMASLQLVADVSADLTLLVSSLHLFRVIQDSSLRHRLKFIFSTCMGTTLASIVHASLIIKGQDTTRMLLAALVEGCVALTVSSIPVVANVFFRLKPTLFHHSFPRGASPGGAYSQSMLLGPLAFAPSPEALSLYDFEYDCQPETPSPAQAKVGPTDVVRTASDLERFSNANLPRLQTEGLAEPPPVHIQLHLISPC